MMLSITKKFGGLLAAAALAVGLAGAAPAATVVFTTAPLTVASNQVATAFSGTYSQIVTTDVAGVRKNPYGPASLNPYSSITGFAEYTFSALQAAVSFVWGTPDNYNSVVFYRGNTIVDTVVGNGTGVNVPLSRATITNIDSGKGFDAIRFVSTQPAFEYAFLEFTPAPIPVPAAGLLLLTALGGIAVLRRRKTA